MKKRIRKHTGEAAAVLFTLLFLCGNWGNCQKVFGADVEKTGTLRRTVIAELCDGETPAGRDEYRWAAGRKR